MQNTFDSWNAPGLMHHGIKGQKWGVRNYQNPDGTLTAAGRKHYGYSEGGSRGLSKKYNKQLKKLNKLRSNTDIEQQKQNVEKYNKRAKTGLKVAGIGAAIAGAGAAAEYGGANLRDKLVSQALKASKESEWNAKDINSKQYTDSWIFWDNQRKNLDGTELGDWNKIYDVRQQQAFEAYSKNKKALEDAGANERNLIRSKAGMASQIHKGVMAAGAAVAVVGAGVAGYNKIKAHAAKVRLTDKGHAKAVEKYKKQYEKMTEMFADTPYSELLKKQGKAQNKKS